MSVADWTNTRRFAGPAFCVAAVEVPFRLTDLSQVMGVPAFFVARLQRAGDRERGLREHPSK
jgi:hypothetical protein